MSITNTEFHSAGRTVSTAHVLGPLQAAVNTLYTWADRREKRRELRELLLNDNHVFADIGLERHDVSQEAYKPFWKA